MRVLSMTPAATCVKRINSHFKLAWPNVRSALHLHRVGKLVYCKANLHLIDDNALHAQGWGDMIKVLAEQEINVMCEDVPALIEEEHAIDSSDSEHDLDQEQVTEWSAVVF